ncbi:MAG: carboxylesterase family protein [archaeon]|nr:carboxylesterase family protein [archaeon]
MKRRYGGRAFLGIPYAAGPVGNLRWAPPQAAAPFSGTFSATTFGPACPQTCDLPPDTCPLDGTSEDCLSLDIYTPLVPSSDPAGYPIMFFYYGGDFIQGGAGVTLYSGLYMVNNTGVVLVVINYRLGALGFLHTSELQGNYAIMDQTYVQSNKKRKEIPLFFLFSLSFSLSLSNSFSFSFSSFSSFSFLVLLYNGPKKTLLLLVAILLV